MSLESRIDQDYVQAMKAKDAAKSSALNYLRAMLKQVKVDKRLEQLGDDEVVVVIKKQIKQRHDSIEQFEKGGRLELAAKERAEIGYMEVYLPAELPAHEINAVIEDVIQTLHVASVKEMGHVIKAVREKTGARADGKLISELVKKRLASL